MPVICVDDHLVPPARLFKLARHALEMSVEEMQDTLCIMDKNTVLKIERGHLEVKGTTWACLSLLLRHTDLEDDELNNRLDELAEEVDKYCGAIRGAASARRVDTQTRRDERRNMLHVAAEAPIMRRVRLVEPLLVS